MSNIRLIKRRIRSTKNIAQITKAMEMVAASKMKKAQQAALMGKTYSDRIAQAARELAKRTNKKSHPLLSLGDEAGRILVILISTNKGLLGGLNTNLFRMIHNSFGGMKNVEYVTLGKKGENFVVKSGKTLMADFSEKLPFLDHVPPVAKIIIDGFITGTYRQVYLAYSAFLHALKQIPATQLLLPITSLNEESDQEKVIENKIDFSEFVIEPSLDEVLNSLLPHYLENQFRKALYEAEASEHSARMVAMKNATDAALDFMHELTLIFNKARQEKITYEIADMVTARMAVE